MKAESATATTAEETPVLFPAGQDMLFGILTRPTISPRGIAVVAMWGGANITSIGRNRLWVRLCRQLAAQGFHALRFDYHGVGDSTGEIKRFILHEPFLDDLRGAIRWLESQGIRRFILVGWCFGARTALCLADRISGLEALVLVSVPLLDAKVKGPKLQVSTRRIIRAGLRPWVLGGLFDRDRRRYFAKVVRKKWPALTGRRRRRLGSPKNETADWINPAVLRNLEVLNARRVPVLLLYGTGEAAYEEFKRARAGPLGDILAAEHSRMDVSTLPGALHGGVQVQLQDGVLDLITRWVGGVAT